eukprot:5101586-Pleurochrysis_carterae.AAC.1
MRREPKRVEAQERKRKGQRRWTGRGKKANEKRAEESGSAREREGKTEEVDWEGERSEWGERGREWERARERERTEEVDWERERSE